MRIVIDLQGAQTESRFRGIGRYSLALAQAIARNAGEHDIWIALNARMPESINELKAAFVDLVPDNQIRIFDVPCDSSSSQWLASASELIRETFIDSLHPDFVLVSSLFEGYWANAVTSLGTIKTRHKTAVILYDLIPLVNSKQYLPSVDLQNYYFQKVEYLKKSDLLLAISESSRREAIEQLGVAPEIISNISASIGQQFKPQPYDSEKARAFLDKLGITSKPILYVPGGFDSRKNFSRLINAYGQLEAGLRKQSQLVIASKLTSLQQEELMGYAKKSDLDANELILTGYLEDKDLIALYSLAKLFVFPSTSEGFGLPVLEAMACGAAVIGSNCSSIPEVIGAPEALFDPFSTQSIADKITSALTDKALRMRLKAHACKQSKKFSWDASAGAALKALESYYGSQKPVKSDIDTKNNLVTALAAIQRGKPTENELHQVANSIAFNMGGDCTRQLLLDVSTIVHSDAKSGIQRVVRSLLQELLSSAPNGIIVQPIYFDHGVYRYANNFTANITGISVEDDDYPIDYYQDDIYLSLDLNMHLSDQLLPLHEHMHRSGVKLNFIVYDLLLIHRPDWWLEPNPALFSNWLHNACLIGDKLICISQSVADELQLWLKQNQPIRCGKGPLVTSCHLGADINSSLPTSGLPANSEQILKKLYARPSFLMVGTIEPRKGHGQTLSAFEQLWAEGIKVNLIIIGTEGWLVEGLVKRIACHRMLGKSLFWLQGISDEYLEKIYSAAACLIAASEGEGFGLPLIEAAQHQLPIIARDIPVFHEVAGTHAWYFKGLEPENLSTCIKGWLKLLNRDALPSIKTMKWLSWKSSTECLLENLLH